MSRNQLSFFVKNLRRQRSWSQAQLSEIADLSLRTIQRLENSGRCAHETLLAVAAAFDIDVQELTRFLTNCESGRAADESNKRGFWWRTFMKLMEAKMMRYMLFGAAGFTSLLAVLIAGHSLLTMEIGSLFLAVRLGICLTVMVTGGLTFFRSAAKQPGRASDWMMLAGGIMLLALGAAAIVVTYFRGMITGDFEYWMFLVEIALVGQGCLTILYLVGASSKITTMKI